LTESIEIDTLRPDRPPLSEAKATMRTLHFISGLPRSGSTLLAGILKQNPRFSAGMSSSLFNILAQVQICLSGRGEMHAQATDQLRRDVLLAAAEGYYRRSETEVVFDTNRSWCGRMFLIAELFPAAKVICCVRCVPEIIDSFERIVRANPLEPGRTFNYDPSGSVYSRVDTLMNPTGPVGQAYACLKDACYGPYADRLLLVPYAELTHRPRNTLKEIYEFLGEQAFTHDFDNVQFDAAEFDARIGALGLHSVRPQVRPNHRPLSLPPDLIAKHDRQTFWTDAAAERRFGVVGAAGPSAPPVAIAS
jgi:sulfotransferase